MTANHFSLARRTKARLALVAVVPLIAALAACGSDDDSKSSEDNGSQAPVGAAATLVPEEFKDKTVKIAVGTDYPPYHYADAGGKIVGVNPEIAVAIAEDMGLKYEIVPISFETIIAGIQSGRYDIAIPAFGITPERLQVLDFVSYVSDQAGYMTLSDSDIDVQSVEDLCGHTWAVAKGTQEEERLREQAPKCGDAGELKISTFNSNNDAVTAVLSGRADGATATYSQLAFASSQQEGKFEIEDYKADPQPLAIGMAKGSGIEKAVLQAVKDIQESGKYEEILANNDVEDLSNISPELVTE